MSSKSQRTAQSPTPSISPNPESGDRTDFIDAEDKWKKGDRISTLKRCIAAWLAGSVSAEAKLKEVMQKASEADLGHLEAFIAEAQQEVDQQQAEKTKAKEQAVRSALASIPELETDLQAEQRAAAAALATVIAAAGPEHVHGWAPDEWARYSPADAAAKDLPELLVVGHATAYGVEDSPAFPVAIQFIGSEHTLGFESGEADREAVLGTLQALAGC